MMKRTEQSKQPYTQIILDRQHVNEHGVLRACFITGEITKLYDEAIINTFGDLRFLNDLATTYHIDFIAPAYKGDKVRLEYETIIVSGVSLLLTVSIKKKGKPIAIGRFASKLSERTNH